MRKSAYFLIMSLLVLGIAINRDRSRNSDKKPVILSPFVKTIIIEEKIKENPLEKIIERELSSEKGEYGIVVKNLKTLEGFEKNADVVFEPASLYKLWVMGKVYQEIESGNIDKNEILSESVKNLNRIFGIDPEFSELPEEEIVTLSVSKAISQMVTISHNYGAMLLAQKIGVSKLLNFLGDNGIYNSSTRNPPRTTANDIALFLEKIYRGEIANIENTSEMINILKSQELNDRIPKYLPENLEVAHKTGELGEYKHDAGIIFSKNGPYIIVVLSKTDHPDLATEKIAEISKAVFDYFNGQNQILHFK